MSREEIIRMAREAGFAGTASEFYMKALERFAALVAAAERERIKQANTPEIEKINAHIKALENAVVAEREACALEADKWIGCELLAEAIRARGEK